MPKYCQLIYAVGFEFLRIQILITDHEFNWIGLSNALFSIYSLHLILPVIPKLIYTICLSCLDDP